MWRYLQLGGISFTRYRVLVNNIKKQSSSVSVFQSCSIDSRKNYNYVKCTHRTELECSPCSRHYSSDNGGQSSSEKDGDEEFVNITFVANDGEEIKVKAKVGENLLKLAIKHDVGVEGACGGELSCTTCHMYLDESYYDKIEGPSVREEDLLDIASFLKPNSRLVCQVNVTKELEGLRLTLPPCTVNFYVDDYKPTHH